MWYKLSKLSAQVYLLHSHYGTLTFENVCEDAHGPPEVAACLQRESGRERGGGEWERGERERGGEGGGGGGGRGRPHAPSLHVQVAKEKSVP
jgi:hypothetical protein